MDLNKLRRLAERFAELNPEQRRVFLQKMAEQGIRPEQLPIPARPRQEEGEDSAPLSFAQQQQWFLWQLQPDSNAYHLQAGITLEGQLDVAALQDSFAELIQQQPSLRTLFRADDEGQVLQYVLPELAPRYEEVDCLSAAADAGQAVQQARQRAAALVAEPFDLQQGPLLRIGLYRTGEQRHLLQLVMHHIIADDASMPLLIAAFCDSYRRRCGPAAGQDHEVTPPEVDYADYSRWQRLWLEAGEAERHLQWWREQLGQEHPLLALPTDYPRHPQGQYQADTLSVAVPDALAQQLQETARQRGMTPFMLLLAGFQWLLQRYSGQSQVRVGVPVANRQRPETQELIGFFVNSQVMPAQFHSAMCVDDLLSQCRQFVLAAQAHQELPFDALVDGLQLPRSLSHNPLFQVMFNHLRSHDVSNQHSWQLPGLRLYTEQGDRGAAQFELVAASEEGADGSLRLSLIYARELFAAETIADMAEHYLQLLQALVGDGRRRLASVSLLTDVQWQQLQQWGTGQLQQPDDTLVQQRIARWGERKGDAIAVRDGQQQLSFSELNRRADALAAVLATQGVGPETLVGVALPRSVDLLVAFLGILRAGAAYVPLDLHYPAERLRYMMSDSGMGWVLSERQATLPEVAGVQRLDLHQLESEARLNGLQQAPALAWHPEQAAYVIYTSGSTGQPKGVLVSHAGIAMHCAAIGERYGMSDSCRELIFMSFSFDGAHERWLTALTHGGQVVMRGDELWSVEQTYQALWQYGITEATFPPVFIRELADWAERDGNPPPVRTYCFGGDAMPRESFDQVRRALRPQFLVNGYGPTETVVTPLLWRVTPQQPCSASYAPIGSVVGERQAYVLDSELNPLPVGMAGELYLGGQHGLARGYLQRPGLSAERFVPNPFSTCGERLYRSGDLVRWRRDGNIDYLGRVDHQVKIRGFRIELGEIETLLRAQPEVEQAVVVAVEQGTQGKRLAVYWVARGEQGDETTQARLKARLAAQLPDYMVPSLWQSLPQLPLNANGKVDRNALPAITLPTADQLLQAEQQPQGEAELALAQVWQQVLKLPQIGRQQNFFELGGDSILSLQIVSRAARAGWQLTPRQLFEHQTLAELAQVACRREQQTQAGLPDAGDTPLLPLQQWFFSLPMAHFHHWNQAVLLHSDEPIYADTLTRALDLLQQHHDTLRLRYQRQPEGWQQHYQAVDEVPTSELLWQCQAASAEEIAAICDEAQRSLHIEQGPLWRAVLIAVEDCSWRLLLVAHHLLVDGVSWRVLLDDLQSLYLALLAQPQRTPSLPARSSSAQAWGRALQALAQSPALAAELPYWQQQAAAATPLPCDHDDGRATQAQQQQQRFVLGESDTRRLLSEAPAAYRTRINDLLLTALGRALCQWQDSDTVLIDLEGHGREAATVAELTGTAELDLSRSLGWMTSLYPQALQPVGALGEALCRVKEQLRAVPQQGLGYGVLRYLGSTEQQQALAAMPQAQVLFNYLGQFSDTEQSQWTQAREPAGRSVAPDSPLAHELSINGQIYQGCLTLNWSYSRERYHDATISRLIERFADELRQLLDHCCSGVAGLTPSDVPLAGLSTAQLQQLPALTGQPLAAVADLYPLSPMQQGLLFHSRFEQSDQQQAGQAYINQLQILIESPAAQPLDVARFQAAWNQVAARHGVLRAGFITVEGRPLQWLAQQVEVPFRQVRGDAEQVALEELQQGFDLACPPLMRVALVEQTPAPGKQCWRMIWTVHHLLLDGWSTSLLLAEVLRCYQGQPLVPVQGQFRDYIGWLQQQDEQRSLDWWQQQLAQLQEPTYLANAVARPQPDPQGEPHGVHTLALSAAHTRLLQDYARQQKVTLNTLVQGAWLLLLQGYCGQSSVCTGVTVAGRPPVLAGIEQQIGLFINTLPLVSVPQPTLLSADWLRSLQHQQLQAREHEYLPLSRLQRLFSQSGQALFDTLVVFENYPVEQALAQQPDGLQLQRLVSHERTNYALSLIVQLTGGAQQESLSLELGYQCQHFSQAQIERMGQHLLTLLQQLQQAEQPLAQISLLAAEEFSSLQQWSTDPQPYPEALPVFRLFEQQEALQPQRIALTAGEQQLSYGELNRRANRLAHQLLQRGARQHGVVGITAERSVELVVSLLAIQKAGAAYVPLDPDFPAERLAYMIGQSGVQLVLCQLHLCQQLPDFDGEVIELQPEVLAAVDGAPEHNPDLPVHGDQLAYVIYTSGSTGRPKGVGNRHRSLYNRLYWIQQQWPLQAGDSLLQKTPYSFDVSVWEFFWPLMTGARLVMAAPGAHRDPAQIAEVIRREQISHVHFVPSMLNAFMAYREAAECRSLQRIICSGEALALETQQQVLTRLPQAQLLNLYGPTEAAIEVSWWQCREEAGQHSVPIGAPIANVHTWILDPQLRPVPQGIAGELYLGGICLAEGYTAQPGLTAERFVPHPFALDGGRLYRTGDLVRWRDDGVIEYLGRIDHQVKIRGLRIELGEIDSQLRAQPGVDDAVVVAHRGPAGFQLVAYWSGPATAAQLHSALAVLLPEYMLPAAWVCLPQLPLNPNGKVDRKALPAPELQRADFAAPQGAAEQALAAIWAEVLKVEQVSRDDNFFELGGDSILSLQIVARARQAGWLLTPKQLFASQTLMALAAVAQVLATDESSHSEQNTGSAALHTGAELVSGAVRQQALQRYPALADLYPLSPMQQGMLFHSLYDPGSSAYINQLQVEMHGLDVDAFRAAWQQVMERHAILRTGFISLAGEEGEQSLQWVAAAVALPFEVRQSSVAEVEDVAAAILQQGFDLTTPPLMRLTLLQLGEGHYHFIWTVHHLLLDGWSTSQLLAEVLRAYEGAELPALQGQFRDYIGWLQQQDQAVSLQWWQQQLAQLDEPTYLASTLARPVSTQAESDAQGGYGLHQLQLDQAQTAQLYQFARQQKVTLNTLVQGAWLQLLKGYSGQSTVCAGATVAGRPAQLPGIEQQVGLFINTLPLISRIDPQQQVGDWLRQLQQHNLAAREHEYLPLYQLQRLFSAARQALFDTLVVFENYPVDQALGQARQDGLQLRKVAIHEQTNYPLTLIVQGNDSLQLAFSYQHSQFSDAQMARLAAHLLAILQQLPQLQQRGQPLACLSLLAADEQTRLQQWSTNPQPYPAAQPVFQLFEQQAAAQPQRIALQAGERSLSYAELNQQANRLAYYLRRRGVTADTLVGVAAERSIELVVALLAIHKAGGAYVPLDPDYPAERLSYMAAQSAVQLVLSQSHLLAALAAPLAGCELLALDQLALSDEADSNLALPVHGEQLAYVIYTSGSTGRPKGVGNSHAALFNRLWWMQQTYQLDTEDAVLQKTPFSFDVSVWEFFWPLLSGARLVMAAPGAHRDPAQLVAVINAARITTLHFVPSMLNAFIGFEAASQCPSLRRIICSGEALALETQQQVLSRLPQVALHNLYGPTEAAIDVTFWQCRAESGRSSVPIGAPIANVSTWVLDADLNPLPVGIAGELYLGGAGLARGYVQRPDLSAERFVPHPLASGERLYRTGDLVRWREDGVLEYLGRLDHQVKIRGLRIELGEIDSLLRAQPGVTDAVVVALRGSAGDQLVAYWAGTAEQAHLQQALAAQLPDYMLPAAWVALAQLPLSANGKVDRKALPAPALQQAEYRAADSEAEQQLAAIWCEVLKVERVGQLDNFFELGGDSILSLQIVSRAARAGWQLSARDLFERQTLQAVAAVAQPLASADSTSALSTISADISAEEVPLLPFQQLFFSLPMAQRQHWNQALLLQSRMPCDAALLEQALQQLLRHHDALRMVYQQDEQGRWQQHYAPFSAQPVLQRVAIKGNEAEVRQQIEQRCGEAQQSLDLQQGPLLRAVLFEVEQQPCRLLLVIHHLVVDGVSWRVLLEDLQQAYQAQAQARPQPLPDKTCSVQQWAMALHDYAHSAVLARELPYWQQVQAVSAAIPLDNPQGQRTEAQRLSLSFTLDQADTRTLLKEAGAAYRTRINDLLLAALAQVLCDWSGQPQLRIELEGHGRETPPGLPSLDLSRTVGWFTSLYPLVLQGGERGQRIKQTKEQLRAIPHNGIGYGLLTRVSQQLPAARAEVVFNYLGQFDNSFGEGSPWQIATEASGAVVAADSPLLHALTINAQVYQGELRCSWSFSSDCHTPAAIEAVMQAYRTELLAVLEHCRQPHRGLTPSDVPLAGLSQTQLDQLPQALDRQPLDRQPSLWAQLAQLYPLSAMQQGMLYHSLHSGDAGQQAYLIQTRVDIDGLDVERFRAAWQAVLDRHEALRAGFVQVDGQQLQWIAREVTMPLTVVEQEHASAEALEHLAAAELQRGFDLRCPPLVKVMLVGCGQGRYQMILTQHHLITDGWSNALLISEVLRHYRGQPLAPVTAQYGDYLGWLAAADQPAVRAQREQWWRTQLTRLDGPTLLASTVKSVQPGSATAAGHGVLLHSWSREQTAVFSSAARTARVTLNTLIQAAWVHLLQSYSGKAQVVFGSVVAGRPAALAGAEQALGLYINTLPVVAGSEPQQPLQVWLQQLQSTNLALRDHETTPLADVQRWAGQPGQALFDSIVVFENYPVDAALRQGSADDLRFSLQGTVDVTNYPMDIEVHLAEQLSIKMIWQRECFAEPVARRLQAQLLHLIGQLAECLLSRPEACVADVTLLPEQEAGQLQRYGINPPRYGQTPLLQHTLAAWAERQPQAIALSSADGGDSLSYAELNRQANQLTNTLLARGIGAEQRVAVLLERHLQLPVALLAVMKSGAAYVPLDPAHPRERLAYMLADCGCSLVISQSSLAHLLPPSDPQADAHSGLVSQPPAVLWLDEPHWQSAAATAPQLSIHPEQLAYLIYTSGSTGQPKGVAVTQGSIARHCAAIADLYGMDTHSCELHFMSFAFDGAHERWLTTLSRGGKLVLRDAQLWTAEQTLAVLKQQQVTSVAFPPAYLRQLAEVAEATGEAPGVATYCFGGEAVPRDSYDLVRRALRPRTLINGYGPTETVVTPLLWKVDVSTEMDTAYAPIGSPVGDRQAYVLDAQLQPVPVGVAGELYLGGELARGYFQRPGLSAERFVPNPFSAQGERLYRTGDLVRWREDGAVDYLGRLDHQVKIRGFRIELGEIEACLLAQPDIANAVVTVEQAANGPRLLAYVVLRDTTDLNEAGLKAQLARTLPDYMLPAAIVALAELPLTPNGKVDRNALPALSAVAPSVATDYEAPRTVTEQALAAIWAEVLGVERIGRHDNFYELGGDSLLSLKVISKIRSSDAIDVSIKLRDLMQKPTIAGLLAEEI
ncbi:non-ribosomal peptide synthase/polyketide synthase [Pokkaliibacter plantistimulans]|uniref:non-ribosomal peptide synthase/polyketide synthase n=1 Tax=Pokkaliibacter plantistimulans TaxID=1635171 RepID=UPI000D743627|nr:non-ribosomal peptide synthase/polyketide synthase [Pokkaliibacter plantistimulans]